LSLDNFGVPAPPREIFRETGVIFAAFADFQFKQTGLSMAIISMREASEHLEQYFIELVSGRRHSRLDVLTRAGLFSLSRFYRRAVQFGIGFMTNASSATGHWAAW